MLHANRASKDRTEAPLDKEGHWKSDIKVNPKKREEGSHSEDTGPSEEWAERVSLDAV